MLLQPRIKTVGTIPEFLNGGIDKKKIKKELKKVKPLLHSKGLKAAITTLGATTAIQLSGFNSQAFAQNNAIPVSNMQYASAEAVPVVGAVEQKIKEQILHAFDPLVDILVALSYPITSVMITAGCLLLLINQKDRGYQMIINAAIGYVIMQMTPLFLKILVGLGGTVATGVPMVLI